MKTDFLISSPIFKTLVYANVYISFCAFAQVILTYYLFHVPFNYENNSYLIFIFLSTFLQYNVQRGYILNNQENQTDRSQWLLKHKKTMIYAIVLSLVAVLFLCNSLSWTSIIIMISAEVVSNLYYLPPVNLRQHGYIKAFLVSAIWIISCTLVPLIENNLLTLQSSWYLVSQFLFISVLCLLFDVKDIRKDYMIGINTYANKFGVNFTKYFCIVLQTFALVGYYFFYHQGIAIIGYLLFTFLVLAFIMQTTEKKHAFYYYVWIDGLLIAQSIVFFFFL